MEIINKGQLSWLIDGSTCYQTGATSRWVVVVVIRQKTVVVVCGVVVKVACVVVIDEVVVVVVGDVGGVRDGVVATGHVVIVVVDVEERFRKLRSFLQFTVL